VAPQFLHFAGNEWRLQSPRGIGRAAIKLHEIGQLADLLGWGGLAARQSVECIQVNRLPDLGNQIGVQEDARLCSSELSLETLFLSGERRGAQLFSATAEDGEAVSLMKAAWASPGRFGFARDQAAFCSE